MLGALAAVSAGVAATVPAVWWEPLHLDEAVTLEFARRPVWDIVVDVLVERGGSPLHFFVERATLAYPGGVEGLRLPSLAFFVAAIPVAGAVARRLCGTTEAALAMPLLALAPLSTTLATFARPYTLLLLVTLVATWTSLRAADKGTRVAWLVAGAVAGLLVHVHPIAPLYAVLAFGTGLVCARSTPRELLRQAWPGAAVLAVAAVPYAYALAVLVSRFGIATGGASAPAGARGRSVLEEAALALTPGGTAGAVALMLAALGGLAVLARASPRTALALALWVAVPIAFFVIAPSGDIRFFGRHAFPVLPAFVLLVVVGCLGAGRLARARTVVGGLLVAVFFAWEAVEDSERLRRLNELRLRTAVATVDRIADDVALFTATGTPSASRPPELLDEYIALEVPGVDRVDELPAIDPRYQANVRELGRAEVARFLAKDQTTIGVWVFAGTPARIARALDRLRSVPDTVAERTSPNVLVVRSRGPSDARSLVAAGYEVRAAWLLGGRGDRLVRMILAVDRSALSASG